MKKLTLTTSILTSILILLPVLARASGLGMGRLDRDRMEIGRALLEVQSANWPSVLPYYTDDVEYHDPSVDLYGIDTMTQFLGQLFESTPDLVTTVEDETLIDGVYSATWTMVGQFSGVPYTAKGISIIKFRDRERQVYYQRDYYTEGDIMANIPGLDEAIVGFRTFYRCAVDPTFTCPLETAATDALSMTGEADATDNRGKEGLRGRGWQQLREDRLEIARALVEIRGSNWPSLLPYYTDDIEYRDPIVDIYGIDTMAEFLERLFGSAPDLITTVEDETLVDGVYFATWTMAGQFSGIPYSAKGMSIVKFNDSGRQVYYARDYYTEGDIMANIPGLDEAVSGFRTFYRCAVDPTFACPLEPAEPLAGLAIE